jgi:hypothetical protein
VNDTTYGSDWGGAITGTVSDALGSVTGVGVSLQQGSGGTSCWTGNDSTFTAACPNYVPVTTGTTSWSLTLPTTDLTSGDSYNAVAQATDSVGNVFTSSPVAFTYNTAAPALPTVAISYPVNGTTYGPDWTGAITGSATADAAGASISGVEVSIQQGSGGCWTGTGNTYRASCPNYVPVTTGTTSWSLTFPVSDLTSGDSYAVTAQATDSDSNVGTSSVVTFAYNTTVPTVVVTFPVNGSHYDATTWTGTITGTASSNSGGSTTITTAMVAIEDTKTTMWWNGTSFSATTQTFVPVSGTTTWLLSFVASNLTSGDSYSVVAQATDSAGNVGTSATVAFTYCNRTIKVPPRVTITYPVDHTTCGINWTGTITGTAWSNAGPGTTITATTLAIEDTSTVEWWNGTSFNDNNPSFLPVSGNTTWLLGFPAGNLTSGNSYLLIARATDSAGNVGTSPFVSFTYFMAPPTVTITYPANHATYGTAWTGTITGTATSNAGAGTTITATKVAIEDTSTNEWWNGTSFAALSQDFVPASGTTTWMLALGSLTSGHSYSVVAQATDSVGNIGTSSTVSFTYYLATTTAPPTVSISYPVNNATYGTNWGGTITGTASSNAGAGTTITAVVVAVENTSTNKWWSGSSFSDNTQSFVAASGNTTWMLGFGTTDLSSGDSYSVIARATDSVGNVGTSPTVSFTYSTPPATPPTVTIIYPANHATYGFNWTGKVTGTASSNSGAGTTITATSVAVENTKTGKWWNGTSFNLGAQSYVAANGTAAWSLLLARHDLNWGVTYKVVAQARDSLGNIGTSSPVSFTYTWVNPIVTNVYPRYVGDCGGDCSRGIYWTITGSDFVPGATVSFPSNGPSADFSVVRGSVKVLNSTTIVLLVRDTGTIKGKATVVVTDPGEAPAFGSITATGKPDPTSLSIIGPSTVAQGAHTILRLKVTGMSCSTWGGLAVYFSNPGITGGRATCSGGIVSVPITVSSSALTGNSSVTVLVGSKDFALSTNGLTVEVTPRG